MNEKWKREYEGREGYRVTPLVPKEHGPKQDGMVRFVCMSDTHSSVENAKDLPFTIPDGDVFLHAGDFTDYGHPEKVKEFDDWLGTLPHKHKILVAGNHDISLDPEAAVVGSRHWSKIEHPDLDKAKSFLTNCTYLEDDSVVIEGIKIFGSPWQPTYGDGGWAFMVDRDSERVKQICSKFPSDTDVLITHGPPLGFQDANGGGNLSGCEEILKAVVKRIRPKYHLFGHIHEGYGMSTNGTTTFINASTCTASRMEGDYRDGIHQLMA